jgi:Cu(I)/Ag(I) efflux system membrane fusion protein
VLALGEGRFKSINVTLGTVFDDVVEVVDGLSEGDEIVVSAQFLLDSESSISSDFKRMIPVSDEGISSDIESNHIENNEMASNSISAWTSATVNEVLLDERMVNLTHGPLDAFNMMGMTMNFMVAEDIDMTQFKVSQDVHVEIIKTPSGMYSIKTVHFMGMRMDKTGDNSDFDHSDSGAPSR